MEATYSTYGKCLAMGYRPKRLMPINRKSFNVMQLQLCDLNYVWVKIVVYSNASGIRGSDLHGRICTFHLM